MKKSTAFLLFYFFHLALYAQQGPYQRGLYANRASLTDDHTGQTWHYLRHSSYSIVSQKPMGAFSIPDRKMDFEYKKPSGDSAFLRTAVKIRVSSGIDEGKLLDKASIKIDNDIVLLRLAHVSTKQMTIDKREVVSSSHKVYQTTSTPARTDVIVKSDGTHELINVSATSSSQWVDVPEYENRETKGNEYYNQGELALDQAMMAKIILSKRVEISLYFEENIVTLKPNFAQLAAIKEFLKRQ